MDKKSILEQVQERRYAFTRETGRDPKHLIMDYQTWLRFSHDMQKHVSIYSDVPSGYVTTVQGLIVSHLPSTSPFDSPQYLEVA